LTTTRRMGSAYSEKATAMLDAAEYILTEFGYGALTSRRVAEHLGVKQRLVYYYFRTMDELVLETFKRLAKRDLQRLKDSIASERALQEIWNVFINTSDSRIVAEFMALANHHEELRTEVIGFIETSRKIQIQALKKAMAASGKSKTGPSAEAIALIGSSLVLALNREGSLGVSLGHNAALKMVRQFFQSLEQ
jgi:AcrR family transcriptional regulator